MPDPQPQKSPFIGGKPAAVLNPDGSLSLLGASATPADLQAYIDRMTAKAAANSTTLQQIPGLADNPAMKSLLTDMQVNIGEAKNVLQKYVAAHAPQQKAPAPAQQAPAASAAQRPLGDSF